MTKEKASKNCCVRLHADLHKEAKVFAYSHGFTLQAFIEWMITDAIDGTHTDWKYRLEEWGKNEKS